jgi:Mg-chelatase subunit ChlD
MTISFATPWLLIVAATLLGAGGVAFLYRRSPYRTLSTLLRLGVLVVLSVALAGPSVSGRDPGIHTIYLIDASASVPPASRERAQRLISESTTELAAPDSAGVIGFAGESRILVARTSRRAEIQAVLSDRSALESALPERGATNLAGAIDHAVAELPQSGDRRIVLVSDGTGTAGNARAAAASARQGGIRVSTVYAGDPESQESRIAELRVPERVDAGDVFEVSIVTESSAAGQGTLYLYRGDTSLGSDRIELSRGRSVLRYRDQVDEPGIYTYRAVLESDDDTLRENNRATAAVRAGAGSRVLYLRDSEEPRPFERALATQDIRVVGRRPSELSATLTELSAFEAVVIDNVPAARFSLSRMNELERYVRQTGGGLIMLGGPASFGAGGYFQTPIEQLLPVSMDVTSTVRVPTLAMLFVVDKSGSMESSPGTGVSKLEVVKEAVLSSVEIMNPYHLVGLISFDAAVEQTVPITRAAERQGIARDVARLRSGGGTVLATAMEEAMTVLSEVNASTKHVIVLSDGLTRDADFRKLSRSLAEEGITVSTVSIGTDANKRLMEMISSEGGGRYYHTDDTSRIPRIFTQETSIVARNVVVEEAFFPTSSTEALLLSGIPRDRLPALDGFVMTYPKDSARQLMDASQGHPLLATWQYGLGRAAAFTSSIDGRWGSAWTGWELLPRFAGQLVDWVQRPAYAGSVNATVDRSGSKGDVQVEVRDGASRYVNGAVMTAALARPDGRDQQIQLTQVGPGRYTGEVELADDGVHVLSVAGTAPAANGTGAEDGASSTGAEDGARSTGAPGADTADARIGPALFPVSVPYPREYADLEPKPEFLEALAQLGGGVAVPATVQRFPHEDLPRVRSEAAEPRQVWQPLLILAAVLFVGEIVLRIFRRRGAPTGA